MTTAADRIANVLRILADDGLDAALNALRYGIEIEFSDADELGSGESECPYDEDDAVNSLIDQGIVEILQMCWGIYNETSASIARIIQRNCPDIEDAVNYCTNSSWSDLVDSELDSMRENWEPDSCEEWQDVEGWTHCADGTSGIVREYQSVPSSFDELRERIVVLMDAAGSPVVPLNGSNHVHVSIPGVHHTVSQTSSLHCCILWELSQSIGQFPKRVLRRLDDSSVNHYFDFASPPGNKFTAVHCHPQGTWEFRLFGACVSPDDIFTNVRLAGTAFLKGYARFHDGRYEIANAAKFRDQFAEAMRNKRPMPESAILKRKPAEDWSAFAELCAPVVSDDDNDPILFPSCECSGCQSTTIETLADATSERVSGLRSLLYAWSDWKDVTEETWRELMAMTECMSAEEIHSAFVFRFRNGFESRVHIEETRNRTYHSGAFRITLGGPDLGLNESDIQTHTRTYVYGNGYARNGRAYEFDGISSYDIVAFRQCAPVGIAERVSI